MIKIPQSVHIKDRYYIAKYAVGILSSSILAVLLTTITNNFFLTSSTGIRFVSALVMDTENIINMIARMVRMGFSLEVY